MARVMKDSGIDWIGEIPQEYNIVRLKNLCELYTGNSIKDEDKELYEDQIDSRPYIATKDIDFHSNIPNYNNGIYIKLDDSSFKIAKKGSTLMCIEGGSAGKKKAFLDYDVSFVNKLCCICPVNVFNKYLFYWIMSPNFEDEFHKHISGLIGGVSVSDLANIKILNPSYKEQYHIASFLDSKCQEIDNVLAKTRSSIEEYKKLKQAIITKAVTKGIRKNRKMKNSGIDWIGEIPEEWSLIPFRRILIERLEKNNPIVTQERLSLSIDKGVTLYSEKTTNLDRFKDDFTQYKVAHKGDLVMNSMNMIVGASGVSEYLGCVSPVYYTYYDLHKDHITTKFYEFVFRSKTMMRVLHSIGKGIMSIDRGDDRVNTCRLKVAREDLRSLLMPVPSADEQREIVDYLLKKCDAIDKLIVKKEHLISELESYKKSLIYEYVTGKKEVPMA